MRTLLSRLLEQRRLILATTALLALVGVYAWETMPREEDPQFPERTGVVIATFPGAEAEVVERLVVEPIEERLAEVEDLHEVFSTARAGVAVFRLELHETVYETDRAWDDVEDALKRARRELPAGVGEPELDHDQVAQEAIVLAVAGANDPLVLAETAERVKRRLLALGSVRRVKLLGDPGEQVTVELDDAVARRLGVDARLLGAQLAGRSAIVPGGSIHLGAKNANLRPATDFRSLAEIAATQVVLPSGSAVPLGELARVRRGPAEPGTERMRWNGEVVVGLGVVPRDGIDRVAFGEAVRAEVSVLGPEIAPLTLEEVVFQPEQVETRLRDLGRSLLWGIAIVAFMLIVTMGPRMGLLVSLVVPLVTFGSLALFAVGGGVLNQISIAALVIALGMLVDNAIVVVEAIQYRLDRGEAAGPAAVAAVRELAVPLGTSTGTTLAAFVPMLISKGNTADFTRSIPVLILLTLTVSYLFAVLVTPVLAELFLKARPGAGGPSVARLADRVARLAIRRPRWVLAGALVALVLSVLGAGGVDRQFFPAADRALLLVDLDLPEGTHLERTDEVSRRIEEAFLGHADVLSVASFIGRGAPHFYYNLRTSPSSPHHAVLLLEATRLEAVEELTIWARELVARDHPEVELVAHRLEQGPPVVAPIEVLLYGHDLEELESAADLVLGEIRAHPASRDVRQDLGLGVPTVAFEIDDAAAGRRGLSRVDVALALVGRTLGTEVGQLRDGDDPVPILVRSSAGQELPAEDLATVDVATPGGVPVPLGQMARLAVEWRPAAIRHRNGSRVVSVLSEVAPGVTADEALAELRPRLAGLTLPAGVRLVYGGELAESGEANAAILRAMPLGVLLLLGFLLVEFNSFRRVAIILVTVPLAAIGVVPGLALSGQPFGFMSLLGIVALVGIVVNNAIVLLDVIETRRAEGASIETALHEAILRRTRPILLTSGTTVAGLLPLAFSSTTLWPPLAWAIISGLAASTVLTLVVVPALYQLVFAREDGGLAAGEEPEADADPADEDEEEAAEPAGRRPVAALLAVGLLGAVLFAAPARAAEGAPAIDASEPLRIDLSQTIARAAATPAVAAAASRAAAAEHAAEVERRLAVLPTVGVTGEAIYRDHAFALDTPLGELRLGDQESVSLQAQVVQPLLDPARRFYGVPAARQQADAVALQATRVRQGRVAAAVEGYLDVLAVDAQIAATDAFVESLEARLAETEERVAAGRVLEADALKVRLDLDSARLDRIRLDEHRRVAVLQLGRLVGHDGAVEPAEGGGALAEPPGAGETLDPATLVAAALAARPDVAALDARRRALELQAKATTAERLPRLEARASWVLSDGDPFLPDDQGQATLRVVWSPFAAGTRAPRRAALEAERAAAEADLTEAKRGIEVEVRDAVARLATARVAVAVRDSGVGLATETLRVETERYGAGRATANDLLVAEAALRRQRTEHALAKLDVARAWVRLGLAVGAADPWNRSSGQAGGAGPESS